MIVLLIMAVIAVYGYTSAQDAATRSKDMYDNNMVAIQKMGTVSADFQQMRAEFYRYAYVPSGSTAAAATISDLKSNIKTNIDDFRDLDLTAEDKKALDTFDTNYASSSRNMTRESEPPMGRPGHSYCSADGGISVNRWTYKCSCSLSGDHKNQPGWRSQTECRIKCSRSGSRTVHGDLVNCRYPDRYWRCSLHG